MTLQAAMYIGNVQTPASELCFWCGRDPDIVGHSDDCVYFRAMATIEAAERTAASGVAAFELDNLDAARAAVETVRKLNGTRG